MPKSIGKDEIEQFIAEGVYSPQTQKVYRFTLNKFVKFAKPGKRGWELRALKFRDSHDCGSYGKALYIAVAKSFLRWCFDEGLVGRNPLGKVRIKPPKKSNRTALTGDESRALQNHLNKLVNKTTGMAHLIAHRDRSAIIFMMYTGMRIGGVMEVCTGDFEQREDAMIVNYKCKGHLDKDSTVFVGSEPIAAITDYLEATGRSWEDDCRIWVRHDGENKGKPITYNGFSRPIMRRFREAGIDRPDACPHILRHTAASIALENGATIRQIQEMLGHSSYNITENYVHSFGKFKDSAEGKISYD